MSVSSVRRAKLFRNARNLAVRLPNEWGIDATEADISYDGNVITIRPVKRSLADVFAAIAERRGNRVEPWEDPADAPPEPVEL